MKLDIKNPLTEAQAPAADRRRSCGVGDPAAADPRSCPDGGGQRDQRTVAPPGYDIYVIDINFAGHQEGVRLAEAISTASPNAADVHAVVLPRGAVLKRAMGVQCRGAFDKREPEDIAALHAGDRGGGIARSAGDMERTPRSRGLLGDMAALIREWNRRISAEQSRCGSG